MNNHDSEKIAGVLYENGYAKEASDYEGADIVVFNTCCIRQNADDKFFGNLSLLKSIKERRPEMLLAVSGCIAQRDKELLLEKSPYVDIVFGSNNISDLPALIRERLKNSRPIVKADENQIVSPYEIPSIRKEKIRAWVPISIGCDNYCTYCVVPYVRGREKSIPFDSVVKSVNELAKRGVAEITLLGQNVNSYGNDAGFERGTGFPELLYRFNDISGLRRIRFTTSHPKDLCDETIKAVHELDKVCEHIHLPVQAGSNEILKKMNRKYDRESYIEKIDKIKNLMPDCSITTDIIVGFPGETEEDFKKTLELVEYCEFDSAYTFVYSPRSKTAAASFDDNVTDDEKKKRFDRLVETVNKSSLKQNKKTVGKKVEVMIESVSRKDRNMLKARTRQNKLVHFQGHQSLAGRFCNVRITGAKTWHLTGDYLNQ
jgi:tRNA-2-methylthio-N6-dimethylallyladenosine synthase